MGNESRVLRSERRAEWPLAAAALIFLIAHAWPILNPDLPDTLRQGLLIAWAVTTVTTVGYGDHFPVTTSGRAIAVGLMLSGIALIRVVTATFASWLIERVQDIEEASQAATHQDMQSLAREVAELRLALRAADATSE